MAAIETYFNAFLAGDVLLTHIVLLGGSILCEALVALGILMETHWPRSCKEWFAAIFIIGGVFFGASFTIALFVFDENLSSEQKDKIIALESHRHLTEGQKERLLNVANRFPKRNFLTISSLDVESWDFTREIGRELKRDGWNWVDCDGPFSKFPLVIGEPITCWLLLEAQIQIEGATESSAIMDALAGALREPSMLGAARVVPEIDPAYPTITIMVGTKT